MYCQDRVNIRMVTSPCMRLSYTAENRERVGKGWGRKRIGTRQQTDRKGIEKGRIKDYSLRRIFHSFFYYPFFICFISFCDPILFLSFLGFLLRVSACSIQISMYNVHSYKNMFMSPSVSFVLVCVVCFEVRSRRHGDAESC